MLTEADIENDRKALAKVAAAFCKAAGGEDNLRALAAQLIRQAIDEVIDAPRTGRLVLSECEKTEKTYLGTKIEILFRSALNLPKGKILDLSVSGEEVDIKHSISGTWMIPQEAVGRVCLLIGEKEETAKFNLGLLMCRVENLSTGRNQDKKFSTSADGLTRALWLARHERYPPNVWQHISPALKDAIFRERQGTPRVAALFRAIQRKPVSRTSIQAVAPQLDPLKRLRKNGGARDILEPEGIAVLWAKRDRVTIAALGLPALYPDEFISIAPETPLELEILRGAGHLQ